MHMVSLELHHAKSTLYNSSRNHHKEHALVSTQYLVFLNSHTSHIVNTQFHPGEKNSSFGLNFVACFDL